MSKDIGLFEFCRDLVSYNILSLSSKWYSNTSNMANEFVNTVNVGEGLSMRERIELLDSWSYEVSMLIDYLHRNGDNYYDVKTYPNDFFYDLIFESLKQIFASSSILKELFSDTGEVYLEVSVAMEFRDELINATRSRLIHFYN